MESKMTKCYDYKQLEVADELRRWHIPDSEIEEELEALARDHSVEQSVEGEIQEGDSVRCICTDASDETWRNRVILLYPGRKLSGAEDAERLICGKKTGDTLNCRIGSVDVSLKVENVVRRIRMEVGDELVRQLDIENVNTVEAYYNWYHQRNDSARKLKANIAIVHYWLTEMAARSEFEIDEEEKKEWCLLRARIMYKGFLTNGYDLKKTPDGTMISEEEAIARAAKEQEKYFIPYVMYCYFCEKDGYALTEADYIAELNKMAVDMGEKVETLMEQTDIIFFREKTYQEHTYHLLGLDAEGYLEV